MYGDFIQPYDDRKSNQWFRSKMIILNKTTNLKDVINKMKYKLNELLENYTNIGSGWILDSGIVEFDILEYKPITANGYFKTPGCIPPRSVINVKNKDN
jgi:hypothetical protein